MTNSRIKQVVLRRAHVIRLMRPYTSGTVLAGVLTAASLYGIGREVWVARVVANMPSLSDLSAVARFFEVAFMNTTFIVQALTVVCIIGAVWAVRDIARTLPQTLRFA